MHPILNSTTLLAIGGGHGVQYTWNLGSSELIWSILAILFFVLLNAFFVAAEFAIVKVRSTQLDELVEEGHKSAILARKALKNLDG